MNITEKPMKNNFKIYVLLAICAILFVAGFSYSTSPLFPYYFGGDSAQFLTMGKAWANGAIPYRDMFDHKGPVIFFVNMLGYLFTDSKYGVWAIQIVFMFFTLLAVKKMSALAEDSGYYTIVAIGIFLTLLLKNYVDGNLTEEYCLPFVTYSIYGQTKYFQSTNASHSPKFAFLYGATCSVCFLTRVTNAVSVCVGIVVITVLLVIKKEYDNLKRNIIAFIAGFAVVAVPFFVYFGILGEIKSFLHGTIFYNIEYSKNMTPWVINASGEDWEKYILMYVPAWSVFITAMLAFIRKAWRLAIFCVLLGVAECFLFFKGALYPQYGMIALPQIVLLLNELILLKETEGEKILRGCVISILAIFCSTTLLQEIPSIPNLHDSFKEYSNRGWEDLMEYIPESERDSFVAYGGNEFKELYLTENILPCYKYFVIQEWHSRFSEKMKENIYTLFSTGAAKWILTDRECPTIEDILDEKYTVVGTNGQYTLYTRK